jgi:hypothetical protein
MYGSMIEIKGNLYRLARSIAKASKYQYGRITSFSIRDAESWSFITNFSLRFIFYEAIVLKLNPLIQCIVAKYRGYNFLSISKSLSIIF